MIKIESIEGNSIRLSDGSDEGSIVSLKSNEDVIKFSNTYKEFVNYEHLDSCFNIFYKEYKMIPNFDFQDVKFRNEEKIKEINTELDKDFLTDYERINLKMERYGLEQQIKLIESLKLKDLKKWI